jgi:hypothetical protein
MPEFYFIITAFDGAFEWGRGSKFCGYVGQTLNNFV